MAGIEQGKIVTRNLWRKLHNTSAYTTVTVKISKTKKIWDKFILLVAEAEVKFHNIRTVYVCYLKRLKMLPSGFCKPKTDVFEGFKADHDIA